MISHPKIQISLMKQRRWPILLVACLLIACGFISWPSSIKAPCYLAPQMEWSLRQTEPDKVVASLENHLIGQLEQMQLIYIDRSDYVNLALYKKIQPCVTIRAGETIALLTSFNDSMNLANLQGQLDLANRQLSALMSGEKEAVLQEAEQSLAYAQAELRACLPQMNRKKELYEKNLIGLEELELAEAEFNLKQINVNLYKARLDVAQTGEKNTLRDVSEAEIRRLDQQIALIENKIGRCRITCPISGIVSMPPSTDYLCLVQHRDTLLAKIALPGNQIGVIDTSQLVSVWIDGPVSGISEAKIIHMGTSQQVINGTPVFWITAAMITSDSRLCSGMTGIARIRETNKTLFARVSASWHKFRMSR